jgi:3-oxoacyl-[acyl-carrier-protein] synthase-3
MKIHPSRMPNNVVEHFGNSSGATIPTNIALNLDRQLAGQSLKVCFAGFGAGLTWSSMLMQLGPLHFCSIQEF